MKKTKYLIIIFSSLIFFSACSSLKEGIAGSKKSGSDAFLVKKKSPLILPPDYNILPQPKKNEDEVMEANDTNIQGIINKSFNDKNQKIVNGSLSQSIEELISKKINDN
tara:strand:- start:855 stop:1181 length:327 start_codon:yes stop_codon:yes gene_type:complete